MCVGLWVLLSLPTDRSGPRLSFPVCLVAIAPLSFGSTSAQCLSFFYRRCTPSQAPQAGHGSYDHLSYDQLREPCE